MKSKKSLIVRKNIIKNLSYKINYLIYDFVFILVIIFIIPKYFSKVLISFLIFIKKLIYI